MNSLKDTGKKTREFRPDRRQQITHNRHWQKETDKKGSGVVRKDTRFPQEDLAKDIGHSFKQIRFEFCRQKQADINWIYYSDAGKTDT